MKLLSTVYLTRRKETEGVYKGFDKTLVFKKDKSGRMNKEASAVFPAYQTQPHGNLKTITLNGGNYKIVWFGRKLQSNTNK